MWACTVSLIDVICGSTRCATLAARAYGDSFALAWVAIIITEVASAYNGSLDDVNSSLVVDEEREIQQLTILYNSYARERAIVLLLC